MPVYFIPIWRVTVPVFMKFVLTLFSRLAMQDSHLKLVLDVVALRKRVPAIMTYQQCLDYALPDPEGLATVLIVVPDPYLDAAPALYRV
jgi:hypothetical protein